MCILFVGTSDVPSHRTIHEVLEAALKAGITLFQFRERVNQL